MKVRMFIVISVFLFLAGLLAVACFSGRNDDGDGSTAAEEWTDPSTGLIWQVESTSGYVDWHDANEYCANLSFAGRDDWRLPTISELRTLIRGCDGTAAGGSCGVTDSCLFIFCQDESCYPCEYGDGPNDGCYGASELADGCDYHWSSSAVADASDRAWAVGFSSAFVYKPRIYYTFHARCVR